jgi:hypothetical protein
VRSLLLATLLTHLIGGSPDSPPQLIVGVDTRVELLSIVFRLAGAPEYVNNDLAGYAAAVDQHFAAHRDHPVVRQARALRATLGISHDAVMMMATHLDALPGLAERVAFDDTTIVLHQRWRPAQAKAFAAALRQFVVDAEVERFFAQQQPFYRATSRRLQDLVQRSIEPQWFEAFFGAGAGDRFILVPGLLNGGGSFGPRVAPHNGPEELWAIIGTWSHDSTGTPTFPASRAYTIAHEFAHSFVNPVIAKHRKKFEEFATGCEAVADLMAPQAYRCWKTVVDESVVRATSVAWARANLPEAEARQAEQTELGRGFFWTAELADSLVAWRASRPMGASWEADADRLGRWFVALGERIPGMRATYDANRPKVVSTSIPDAATDVDPATALLVVTFDRPMVRGWSIEAVQGTAGVLSVPAFRAPRMSPDSLRFEVEMELTPGTEYGFALNGPFGGGFRSAEGAPLAQTRLRFRTAASAQ